MDDFLFKDYSNIFCLNYHTSSTETATRLSPECCEHLVKSGATEKIVTLIRSCNRSLPSMETISLSVQVLLNLSKVD